MRSFVGIPFRSLAAAALCALSYAPTGAQPASTSTTPAIVTGTVVRIDSQAGTFDLLTAIGHAVRTHRIHYASDVKLKGRGARAGISAIARGAVCRVECRPAAAGSTAYTVEVIEPAPARTQ